MPSPDPGQGVFETLLVRGGEPVDLDAHLARLAESLLALFGAEPPEDLVATVRGRARPYELARLRITAAPPVDATRSAPLMASLKALAVAPIDQADVFPGPERAAELRTLECTGGLGRHKWADRRPLAAIAAPAVPLLLDRDEILEAGRANVFAVHDGALFTPVDDGRILPGIARAGAIACAREAGIEVEEGPLTRVDLLGAEEVFLTGSVRGVEAAGSLDGAPLAGLGEFGGRIATRLARKWRTGRLAAARS